jgi:hypothetical protein
MAACSSSSLDDFPGLSERLFAYYELEKQKKWNDTYAYRTPAFRQSVSPKLYVDVMSKNASGWVLKGVKVRRIERLGSIVRVEMEFTETPPANRYPVPVGELSTIDCSEWELIDGKWQAWATGGRGYLSMNTAVVTPNTPVNADARGHAGNC